ncbi:UTRA domain-containing protein [Streptomyces sp. CA-181903]|uniref:UTRA domain-containing protein n=1 Tax=Streptomyces sp. CA-181903 TaxID=3240055 RepID=UPI003D926495
MTAAQPWRPGTDGEGSEETTLVRQLSAPESMAEWGIAAGTQVVERTRVRYVSGIPVQHKTTVLPYEVAARMPSGYEGVPPMLAPVGADAVSPPRGTRFADWLGWDVAGTECAITAEPMTAEACAALQMPEGSPGFRVVAVTRNSEGARCTSPRPTPRCITA